MTTNSSGSTGKEGNSQALKQSISEHRLLVRQQLTNNTNIDNPSLEADLLLSYVLNKARSFLYAFPEHSLSQKETEELHTCIKQRMDDVPLAYIIKSKNFWSLDFIVSPDVLIPRDDTETLVEHILEHIQSKTLSQAYQEKKLLELGTGSGCLAIALALELPDWTIVATDISSKALALAKENAKVLGATNITFIESDWFNNIPAQSFNIISSNPPYIASDDTELEKAVAQYEPSTALIAEDNGLAAYKAILQQAKDYSARETLIAFEIGHTQGQALSELMKHLQKITIRQDIHKKDRVISGLCA